MARISGGRSTRSTVWPGAITVSQWQKFSSWRTLPGKSNLVSTANASGVNRLTGTPSVRALAVRKCWASAGMSSTRSRSGGSRRRITFKR